MRLLSATFNVLYAEIKIVFITKTMRSYFCNDHNYRYQIVEYWGLAYEMSVFVCCVFVTVCHSIIAGTRRLVRLLFICDTVRITSDAEPHVQLRNTVCLGRTLNASCLVSRLTQLFLQ